MYGKAITTNLRLAKFFAVRLKGYSTAKSLPCAESVRMGSTLSRVVCRVPYLCRADCLCRVSRGGDGRHIFCFCRAHGATFARHTSALCRVLRGGSTAHISPLPCASPRLHTAKGLCPDPRHQPFAVCIVQTARQIEIGRASCRERVCQYV